MTTQTRENIAAIHLRLAIDAIRSAILVMDDLGTDEADQHAAELIGAIKSMERWTRELDRMHREKTR